MNPLWLPTAQIREGMAADFPAGSLIFFFRPNRTVAPALAMRIDLAAKGAAGGAKLMLTLTDWYEGRSPRGDIETLPDHQAVFGFERLPGQEWSLEIDPLKPLVDVSDAGCVVGWRKAGLVMMGFYGRHDTRVNQHLTPIDPATWLIAYDPDRRDPVGYSAAWRLRLHLSEREVVTVAEADALSPS